jgi:hypothetical protein
MPFGTVSSSTLVEERTAEEMGQHSTKWHMAEHRRMTARMRADWGCLDSQAIVNKREQERQLVLSFFPSLSFHSFH